jgi:hypothetical protein
VQAVAELAANQTAMEGMRLRLQAAEADCVETREAAAAAGATLQEQQAALAQAKTWAAGTGSVKAEAAETLARETRDTLGVQNAPFPSPPPLLSLSPGSEGPRAVAWPGALKRRGLCARGDGGRAVLTARHGKRGDGGGRAGAQRASRRRKAGGETCPPLGPPQQQT